MIPSINELENSLKEHVLGMYTHSILGRKGWLLILTGGIENRLGSIRFKAQRHVDG